MEQDNNIQSIEINLYIHKDYPNRQTYFKASVRIDLLNFTNPIEFTYELSTDKEKQYMNRIAREINQYYSVRRNEFRDFERIKNYCQSNNIPFNVYRHIVEFEQIVKV